MGVRCLEFLDVLLKVLRSTVHFVLCFWRREARLVPCSLFLGAGGPSDCVSLALLFGRAPTFLGGRGVDVHIGDGVSFVLPLWISRQFDLEGGRGCHQHRLHGEVSSHIRFLRYGAGTPVVFF